MEVNWVNSKLLFFFSDNWSRETDVVRRRIVFVLSEYETTKIEKWESDLSKDSQIFSQ